MIRVIIPYHLRNLAQAGEEIQLNIEGPVTQRSVLDALEQRYPMLCGTIRDHVTKERRAFLRFFACQQDLSHDPPDTPLPPEVISGAEPFIVLGAIVAMAPVRNIARQMTPEEMEQAPRYYASQPPETQPAIVP